jgi:hypothetical protein
MTKVSRHTYGTHTTPGDIGALTHGDAVAESSTPKERAERKEG